MKPNIYIFNLLVEYHCEENLAKCLPYIKNGMISPPTNHYKPIKEGQENKEYDGILILKNGITLLENLVSDKLINKRDIDESKDVSTIEKFFDFLNNREDEDGVYIYDSANNHIVRVSKVNYPERQIEGRIPLDFVYHNGNAINTKDPWIELRLKIGTKTRLAIELTQFYPDVDAYIIKRSGYTKLGMGKTAHFKNKGLFKEFFFMHYPKYEGEFINPEHKIVGVFRDYENLNSTLVRVNPRIINPLSIH